jgi:hypothetical protein
MRFVQFAERYRWDEAPVATGPGVYALFAVDPDALLPVTTGRENIVYLGMTEDGLEARDHFAYAHSGKSSPRRSLGAILKVRLGLMAIPRAPGKSINNVVNYRFPDDGEARLTAWMREHLRLAVEPLSEGIRTAEQALIAEWKPPLCLTHWRNPQKRVIAMMRQACRIEAERNWGRNYG